MCRNFNAHWLLLQVKSGKAFLKEYYLKHRALSERDLDDLVTKSSMSYEQVRDWFSETARRAEEGRELFSDEEEVEEEEAEDEDEEEDEEEEEEAGAAEHADSDGEMEAKEQGEEATDDDCNEEEEEEEEDEEEEVVKQDETIQEECEGVSQSQPQAEEQT